MRIAILGSGTGVPDPKRGASGYAVSHDDRLLLVDGGSGSLEKLVRAGYDYRQVELALYTHCHADHTLDFVSLLHALNFTPGYTRTQPLRAVGPPGFVGFAERLLSAFPSLNGRSYALELIEAEHGAAIDGGWVDISAAAVPHGNARANAYRLEAADGVLVFSGDCSPSAALVEAARGADVMVAEASFAHATPDSEHHMTAGEVGHLARAAGVSTLILTHFYPGAGESEVRAACAREFGGPLIVGRDGMLLELVRGELADRH